MIKRIKNKINKYLENLAKQNEATFGKDRLDCCELRKITKKG